MSGSAPNMISIPETLDEVQRKLSSNRSHPGLLCAYNSLKNRRAPHTATILLVGQTGSGKSSTVNSLFDNEKLAEVGDGESCSSDIVEYEVDIPMGDIGVQNSILRVIDTPGFGDTRSPDLDAQLIATLLKLFNEHQDLKNRVPNVVLIVTRFDETRYAGENSAFVKMLKGLESLRDKIFDTRSLNVILCCTHFASVKKSIRENPKARCDDMSLIVTQFTSLPRPTVILAENDTEDMTKEANGYYKLANGDYYPYNLFQAIQDLTTKAGDPMGESIFRAGFKKLSQYFVRKARITKMLPTSNIAVTSASKVIQKIQYQLNETQVNNYLQQAWDQLNAPSLRNDYPGTLLNVQRVFQRKGIQTLDDVPKDKLQILQLMKEIQQNPAIPDLLAKSVGLNLPKLDITLTTGQCYSLVNLDVIPNSIFEQWHNFEISPLGYLVPDGITVDIHNETKDICEILTSQADYINSRLKSLNIDTSVKANAFGIGLNVSGSGGYNIMESDSTSSETMSFSALREQRLFRMSLKNQIPLSTDFKGAVNDLPTFNQENFDNVQKYKTFFARYGTHVVASCFGGGAVEMSISVKKSKEAQTIKDKRQFALQIQVEYMNKFGADYQHSQQDNYEYASNYKTSESKFSAHLRGGDMRYHGVNLGEMKPIKSKEVHQGWIDSLLAYPVMLKTNMTLVPISFYAKSVNEQISREIDLATKSLFDANLEYIPPPPKPVPPPRPEVPAPPPPKSCCLKKGTLIVMADGTKKCVEDILPGDHVMDVDMKSSRVIGANYVFLGRKEFYGFDGNSPFFTHDHIFYGPRDTIGQQELLVASKHSLMTNNPFMEQMNVQEMVGNFDVLKFDEKRLKFRPVLTSLITEDVNYDPLTRIYYLIVDSPTGTYIANNFVCRHELPPFKDLSQTLFCLQSIVASDSVKDLVREKQMSPTLYSNMEEITNHLEQKLMKWKSEGKFKTNDTDSIGGHTLEISRVIAVEALGQVLGNTPWATMAMLIYARCGKLLKELTDESIIAGENSLHLIVANVVKEIEAFARKNNF